MTTSLRRPLIDIAPDKPLKFHGYRIARDGSVYATTTPMVHGRTNPNYEVRIGTVRKHGRIWIASSPYLADTQPFERQQDAGNWLHREVEKSEANR